MKTCLLLICALAAVSYSHAASIRVRRQLVPREFANINIENYLKNERAVAFQLKCIVYDGPCDRIGKYLKITIPELLTNQCRNCDPEQRMRAGRLVAHIQQNFPKEWEDAVKKFQGGQVKADDAQRLETILGVKLDPKLVSPATGAETSTTEAIVAAKSAEASSTAAPTAAPTTSATTSTTTTTAAPVSSSSSTTAETTTSTTTAAPAPEPAKPEAVVEPAAADAVPVVAETTTSTTTAAPVVSSEAPVVEVSSTAAPAPSTPAAAA